MNEMEDDFTDNSDYRTMNLSVESAPTPTDNDIKFKMALDHKTDMSVFDRMHGKDRKNVFVTPEEAQRIESVMKQKEAQSNGYYADPVIAVAAKRIEDRTGHPLTYDEFDKLCKTYASDLAEIDRKIRHSDSPDPGVYNSYYQQLIQNKKVLPAWKVQSSAHEQSLVHEIDALMTEAKRYDDYDMHVKAGSAINIHHKGKVIMRDEDKNREIIINNYDDVKLLHMRHRQAVLDKMYSEDIEKVKNGGDIHSNDGFE